MALGDVFLGIGMIVLFLFLFPFIAAIFEWWLDTVERWFGR